MSRTARVVLAALAGVALLGAALGGWFAWQLHRPHAGWSGPAVVIDLPRGLDARAVLSRLGDAGVLRDPRLLHVWLLVTGEGGALRAGEYRFDRPVTPLEVLRRLREGDVLLHAVTIPEGLVLEQIAQRFAEAGLADERALLATLQDPELVRDLAPAAQSLEGYCFPDTYRFPRGESTERLARAMVRRFRETVGPDYAERARKVGLTLHEAVTLASLVEKETSVPEERGRISRVFHNRLARGMKLQCDPTVLYALARAGQTVPRLRQRHLEFDSPWNTYRVDGLPPGPIASAGAASLEAAVAPPPGNDLYFVAAPQGGHRFSETLASHLDAVREWRRYLRSSR